MVGGIIIANSIDCAPKWGKDRNVSAAFANEEAMSTPVEDAQHSRGAGMQIHEKL